MNKYPSDAHLDDKYKAARLSRQIRPKHLRCSNCERETPHYPNRGGVNGTLFVCRVCGAEQAMK